MTETLPAYRTLVKTIEAVLRERGDEPGAIGADTPMADTGLDSLDVAAVVVRMEEQLGFDPFTSGNITEFPRTVGDFAALYVAAQ